MTFCLLNVQFVVIYAVLVFLLHLFIQLNADCTFLHHVQVISFPVNNAVVFGSLAIIAIICPYCRAFYDE